ncbi:MAG: MOSC domain-containing protein [Acidimicrobiia bacterium]
MAHLHQINVSQGGVPKLPVDNALIDEGGVVGDRQADRVHHGRPEQALCLYSLEVIEELRREGHPIAPGSAGENLTLAGLDWAALGPDARLRIGSGVEIEVTWFTTPCDKNAGWFLDGKFSRMSNSLHPGSSRLYARVLRGGSVKTGDEVELVD